MFHLYILRNSNKRLTFLRKKREKSKGKIEGFKFIIKENNCFKDE